LLYRLGQPTAEFDEARILQVDSVLPFFAVLPWHSPKVVLPFFVQTVT